MAKTTIENFVEPAIRLYERKPGEACASTRFGEYVRRWVGWTTAGVAVACIPAPIGAHTSRRIMPNRLQDAPKELALE